jgi:transcriptional regulator with XRE-family HTH domain
MEKINRPHISILLSANIKKARSNLSLSQQQLAEKCGLSTSYIAEIEIGRKFPSANTLQIIADTLSLKPYQLFFDEEEWHQYDRYNELTQLLSEIKESVNNEITKVIQKRLTTS